MISRLVLACAVAACALPAAASDRASIDVLVAQHAKAHGVPEALVHRIIQRESGYNPRASNRGNLGLMQIRYATARGMGYTGPASGLLDANTNLAYAVPYLANAYKVAGGSLDRAVSLYSGGYYYAAKRKGLLRELRTGASGPVATNVSAPSSGPSLSSLLSSAFTSPAPR
jgi:soluble lytic murein transglycosylase-like protein